MRGKASPRGTSGSSPMNQQRTLRIWWIKYLLTLSFGIFLGMQVNNLSTSHMMINFTQQQQQQQLQWTQEQHYQQHTNQKDFFLHEARRIRKNKRNNKQRQEKQERETTAAAKINSAKVKTKIHQKSSTIVEEKAQAIHNTEQSEMKSNGNNAKKKEEEEGEEGEGGENFADEKILSSNSRKRKSNRDWALYDQNEMDEWKRLAKLQQKQVIDPIHVYDNVAIVTKVHSSRPFIGSVVQSVCLVKAAYNFHRNYPWIVFTTLPWPQKDIERAKRWAAPANLTVVLDSEPIEHIVQNVMTQAERDNMYQRCQCCRKPDTNCCKNNQTLFWDWWCYENAADKGTNVPPIILSYLQQAQFRTTYLWGHKALADYKYMIWIDNDALPTKPWIRDPMKMMVENDLVVMFDNLLGKARNDLLIEKMNLAYNNTSVCNVRLNRTSGSFQTVPCSAGKGLSSFQLIHGMHHITNLDFYRLPENLEMNRLMTQHKGQPWSREWDDQIGVTVVPAVRAPERGKNGERERERINDAGLGNYWKVFWILFSDFLFCFRFFSPSRRTKSLGYEIAWDQSRTFSQWQT